MGSVDWGLSPNHQASSTLNQLSPGSGASSRNEAILQWLRFYEGGGDVSETKTKWTLQRVAWRAGELRLREAAQPLEELLRFGDPASQYAVLWALCRCGDTSQVDSLQLYAMDPGYTGRIAREGLRLILQGDDRTRFLETQRARIAWSLRDKFSPVDSDAILELLLSGVHDREISRVYLEDNPEIQATLRTFVQQVELTTRNVEAINELFQAALLRADGEMFGATAYRLETAKDVATYKALRRFKRRTRRSLRRTATADPQTYLALATGVLTHASSSEDAENANSLLGFTLSHAKQQEAAWRDASQAQKEALRASEVDAVRYFGNTLI